VIIALSFLKLSMSANHHLQPTAGALRESRCSAARCAFALGRPTRYPTTLSPLLTTIERSRILSLARAEPERAVQAKKESRWFTNLQSE
jgi:hypothetical protein